MALQMTLRAALVSKDCLSAEILIRRPRHGILDCFRAA